MEHDKEPINIDMTEYIDSKPVVEQCLGCNKVFDFIYQGPEDAAPEKRCLAYYNPAAKWPRKDQQFAMHTVVVRERNKHGQPTDTKVKEVPIVSKYCPLASHYKADEVINTSDKVRSGQQKQK